ncbi:MAG: hypothetical protein DRO43_06240, partial [Candidatus Hecatellales archaeon]
DALAKTYGKLPHEILSGPVETILADLETLALSRELEKPAAEGSLAEQIKRKRRMLGLTV